MTLAFKEPPKSAGAYWKARLETGLIASLQNEGFLYNEPEEKFTTGITFPMGITNPEKDLLNIIKYATLYFKNEFRLIKNLYSFYIKDISITDYLDESSFKAIKITLCFNLEREETKNENTTQL